MEKVKGVVSMVGLCVCALHTCQAVIGSTQSAPFEQWKMLVVVLVVVVVVTVKIMKVVVITEDISFPTHKVLLSIKASKVTNLVLQRVLCH